MAATKRSPSKKSATAKNTTPEPTPAPSGPSYEDLYAARRDVEETQAAVTQALRTLARAQSNQGDFAQRDRDMAAALDELNMRRSEAAAAQLKFTNMKRQAGGRS